MHSLIGSASDDNDASRLDQHLSDAWPTSRWCSVGVVVACSGGADSVALLCALHRIFRRQTAATGFLVAAHFNHGLRGAASDSDQQFVRQLAEELGVRFFCGRAESAASDEASLRNARTEFLVRIAKQSGCRYIALGHSADDNVETILQHLFRGTGPAGLAGIRPHRAIDDDLVLMRPMIGIGRELIRASLRAQGRSWREDGSNRDSVYTRNWIRNELIPMIQSRYPSAVDAIGRAAQTQADWRTVIDGAAETWIRKRCSRGETVHIDVDQRTDSAVVVAGLQRIWDNHGWPRGSMTRSHWTAVADAVAGRSDKPFCLPGGITVTPIFGDHATAAAGPVRILLS